jgi:hypothetical protein
MKLSIDEIQVDLLFRYAAIVDSVRPILESHCRSYGFGGEYEKCKAVLNMILDAAEHRCPGSSDEYPEAKSICRRP